MKDDWKAVTDRNELEGKRGVVKAEGGGGGEGAGGRGGGGGKAVLEEEEARHRLD